MIGWPARIEGEMSGSHIQFRLQVKNPDGLWIAGEREYDVHEGIPPDYTSGGGSCIV
jgi:hypothetical protein